MIENREVNTFIPKILMKIMSQLLGIKEDPNKISGLQEPLVTHHANFRYEDSTARKVSYHVSLPHSTRHIVLRQLPIS